MIRKTFIVDVGTKNEFVITPNSNDIKIVINDINEVLFNFAEFIKSNTTMLDSVIIMIDLSKVEDDLMLHKMLKRYLNEYCLEIPIVSITKQFEENRSSNSYEETLKALDDINTIVNKTVKSYAESCFDLIKDEETINEKDELLMETPLVGARVKYHQTGVKNNPDGIETKTDPYVVPKALSKIIGPDLVNLVQNKVKEVAKDTVVSIDTKTTSEKPKKKYKKHNRNNDPYYHQGELGYNWFNLKHSSISGPDNW